MCLKRTVHCHRERKCQNLQWMPSKMFLQKQAKGQCTTPSSRLQSSRNITIFPPCTLCMLCLLGKKDKKKNKVPEKKEAHHSVKSQCPEVSLKPTLAPSKDDPPVKKCDTPPPMQEDDKQKQQPPSPPPPSSSPNSDPSLLPSLEDPRLPQDFQSPAYKKDRKLCSPLSTSPHTTASSQPPEPSQESMQQQTQAPAKKEGSTKSPSNEPKKKLQPLTQTSSVAFSDRNC